MKIKLAQWWYLSIGNDRITLSLGSHFWMWRISRQGREAMRKLRRGSRF